MSEATYEDFDLSEVKEFFSTPKPCFEKLRLGEFDPVRWNEFYRLWNGGRGRRSVGIRVLTAWKLYKRQHLRVESAPPFELEDFAAEQACRVALDQDTLGPGGPS